MPRRFAIGAASVLVFALVGVGVAWGWIARYRGTPAALASDEAVLVDIPRGAHLGVVTRRLAEAHVIDNTRAFAWYARYVRRAASDIKAGEFELRAGMTPDEVLDRLIRGEVKTYKVTVPEGLNIWDLADVLANAGIADRKEFLDYVTSLDGAVDLGVGLGDTDTAPRAAPGVEGYLYPDTYQFARGLSPAEIAGVMVARFKETFDETLRAKARARGLSVHQAVTLASIVEKETGAPGERAHISGVFHNRLQRGMKLQTDPTVIYSVLLAEGGRFDGNLRKSHLVADHPFNTYAREGLPPGPIASPGRAALEAAVRPARTDDLYFVSRNDGTHEFCSTLTCHNDAVRAWQVEYHRARRRDAQAALGGGTAPRP